MIRKEVKSTYAAAHNQTIISFTDGSFGRMGVMPSPFTFIQFTDSDNEVAYSWTCEYGNVYIFRPEYGGNALSFRLQSVQYSTD